MAISPVIANCVQVRLLGTVPNQGAINVLHAVAQAGVTVNQALANTLGSAIKTAWTTNLAPLMGAQASLVRVGVRDLRVANAAEFLDTGAAVGATGTGDSLPGQVALCITLRTAKSGKSFRGRVYLGGWTEAVSDAAGSALPTAATGAVNFITAVQAAMASSQLTLAVASRPAERTTVVRTIFHADGTSTTKTLSSISAKSGGVEPVTAIASRTAAWETQRRRNNGRGGAPTFLSDVASHTF